MKTAIIAAILACVSVMPAFAGQEDNNQREQQRPVFEQRKADILQRIQRREGKIREEKACIQAARSHEEVRLCREKYGPKLGFDHKP